MVFGVHTNTKVTINAEVIESAQEQNSAQVPVMVDAQRLTAPSMKPKTSGAQIDAEKTLIAQVREPAQAMDGAQVPVDAHLWLNKSSSSSFKCEILIMEK